MAIFGLFIGVDKCIDPEYRELTGAKRDATALWALFTDTMPDMQAELLTDENASSETIRYSIKQTLGSAGANDTVILSFAGHGTPTHHLVAHNTIKKNLADTSIEMKLLSDEFLSSKAGKILCILDCCFSGAAPSRGVGESLIARGESIAYEDLIGNGRALLAACAIDEQAYEMPNGGHGLLTKAIIEVLTSAKEPLSTGVMMKQVMDKVRIEAIKMGKTQTPVSLDHVKGGFSLLPLRMGDNYRLHFPETSNIKVTANISDLSVFGFKQALLKEWADRYNGLNELQLEAVNDSRILDGKSLLVVAPTSSGKTFIGELASAKAISEGRKAVFLLPYRAVVNEKYDQFSAIYAEAMGMRVIRCTGDYQDQTTAFMMGKYDLAVLTYEMFLNLTLNSPSIMNQIGLVVLDEAQFVNDPRRGMSVELLLTNILALRESNITPQIIALSAVIGDINQFDEWLGIKRLVSLKRPVPLQECVFDRNGILQSVDSNKQDNVEQLISSAEIVVRKDKPGSQDMIVPLVRHLVQKGEKVIVFRNQRGPAQGCAMYLAKDLALPMASDAIALLPNHDLSSISKDLRVCLEGGTAFHNTNLLREERLAIERSFRDPESNLRVLVATTTLAAGINTPASTVILAEQEFVGEDGRAFTVAEYKNMAGRAGRLGFNEEGKSIILADSYSDREVLFEKYVKGQPESMNSSFDIKDLDTWIVKLLAQVPAVKRTEITKLLANTYGGYLAIKSNPEWRGQMESHLERLLDRMIGLELVETLADRVQLTMLGRACGESSLSFESSLRLVELLKEFTSKSIAGLNLVALIQILNESDGGYTPLMKRGVAETHRPTQVAEKYGRDVAKLLQKFAANDFDWYARCKRAAILWDWINGVSLEEIEKFYTPNFIQGRISYGDIQKFADNTRFHLRSAQKILTLMLVENAPSAEEIDVILKQLERGLPSTAVKLLEVPIVMTRGQYLALNNIKCISLEDIQKLDVVSLEQLVGKAMTKRLMELPLENSKNVLNTQVE